MKKLEYVIVLLLASVMLVALFVGWELAISEKQVACVNELYGTSYTAWEWAFNEDVYLTYLGN
jgi:hypothetical protein